MQPSPLERAVLAGREVWLKREDLHELGAFKWRGALPALEKYRSEGADAVVTASTGNHGAAAAWAARRLGMRAVVYAPRGASRVKVERMQGLGADLRLTGDDFDSAKAAAAAWAQEAGLPYFEDGAEPAQFDGYAAIGAEILAQLPRPAAAVVVPVGNGALLIGIGRAVAGRMLRVGVVPKQAPVMARSWAAGRVVEAPSAETFADGLAVRVAIPLAVDELRHAADRMVEVSERAIARGVAELARAGVRAEGAAGAAVAALAQLDVDPVVVVVTGRNIDDELHRRCLERPESFAD
jgi:threonine dehydratase